MKAPKLLSGLALSLFSVASFAEIPAAVGTTLTAVQGDALDMIELVWPFVLGVFGALLLIKIFKRAGSKI